MRILLDENFSLALHRRLAEAGYEVDHIIVLGQRGLSDTEIRRRLLSEPYVFLTLDEEFLDLPSSAPSRVLLSRVAQSRPIRDRVALWVRAIEELLERRPRERLFEILDTGELVPSQPPS